MKILQINKFYYRRRGAETYFLDLIELLQKQGHEVAVFAMEHEQNLSSPYNKYFVSKVDYSRQTITADFKAAVRMFWSREAQKKLSALIAEFKPDVAHIHNIYHQISPSILRTLKQHHIPIVQTLHDYKLLCPNYELYTQKEICERCKGHKYLAAVKYKCLKNSRALSTLAAGEMTLHKYLQIYEKSVDCFISPSAFLRDKVLQWQEAVRRIEVLPNFINCQTITPNYEPGNYLLYFGAFLEIKGVELLLDNFKNNHYDCQLLLAGSGPKVNIYKATYESNNIKFLDQLTKPELYKYIQNSLAVIVPSRYYENFPYSIVEAMAHGKPIIASAQGGIPELVKNNISGYLFDPQNKDSLTEAIKKIIGQRSNPEKLIALGKAGRSQIETLCNPNQHYAALLKIYESVLA